MDNGNPQSQNQYTINNVQQLFAINNNLVNFQSKFVVKSLSNEPFQGLVVNQQMLDSGQTLELRSADQGIFSGEITQDNNVPDNWYLALKSIKPNKVSIDFQTVAISPRPANSNPVAQIARTPPRDSGSSGSSWSSLLNFQNLLKVLMGAGILSVIYVLFKKFWKVSPARQQQRPAIVGFEHGEGEGPGFEPVAFQPTSPAASGITATSNVSVPPAAAAGDAAAPAVAPLEGTTTAAVLGEDLLAKVKNLPEV